MNCTFYKKIKLISFSSLRKEVAGFMKDWPWPVSRKTSEEGVKKSFLFEPLGEFIPLFSGKPSSASKIILRPPPLYPSWFVEWKLIEQKSS
jgi:hypothetical protein